MNKELIISTSEEDVKIALTEDKQLVELHTEKVGNKFSVGDIFIGRVKKIMQGLNAAFVDLGDNEQDGFMHYLDLGPLYYSCNKYMKGAMNGNTAMRTLSNFKIEPVLAKDGNVGATLSVGQYLMVQVSKEPISTKGPKLTGNISLAGHFIVLTPFENTVAISQKIRSKEERSRLKRLVQSIKPENYGIIVRTNAQGKTVAELDADLRNLMSKWAQMTDKLKRVNHPMKLLSELNAASSVLREVLSDDFNTVYVDSEEVYDEIREYVRSIMPGKESIVRHYKLQTPIFDQFGITRDIRRAFGKIVTIRSGVYLYIEHTEAMHVIDVNSGNHIKAGSGQEDTALQVNIESAVEIARQLRLRDMGGIIIIDFVDMMKAENRKKLFDVMTEEMRKDKTRHTILPLSKFGLMQITRQRLRPAVEVDVQEKCPLCDGTGKIKSSLVVVDEIEADIKYHVGQNISKRIEIVTHPYVQAYLVKGFPSIRLKWMIKYKRLISIKASNEMSLLEFKFSGESKEVKDES